MIGKTESHYKILEKLGEGGMGVVYKAEDTKLKRTVALKFLPSSFSSDKDARQRLIHEAQSASLLDHPNICTIYEIGETEDGQVFISMAYYKGETLKEKITKGPLQIDETINIALQICKGLEKAHKNDIIHRDIKPANIFITTDEIVKILDFGLAKSKGQTQLTKIGSTVGTIDYMSPEQARGEEIDGRTDIWSLGIVMYEMLTGRLPFSADFAQAVIYSLLNEDPKSVHEVRNEIHKELSDIVSKTLIKDPAKRYQCIQDFWDELNNFYKSLDKTNSQSGFKENCIHSIAVLPFINMSADTEQEYFCEGMAEEIINSLTNIKKIKVTARTSAFAFKDSKIDIREIGKKLGVDYVLEGSVRKAANRLRITAQLIIVENGFHIWSQRFDRDFDDVFAIQDEISFAIVENLKIALKVGEKSAVLKRSTTNTEAYNLYLKGLYYFARPSPESYSRAINFFDEALEIDSNFALAHVGTAKIFASMGALNFAPPQETWHKAKAALEKALRLDENLVEALSIDALINLWYEWDWNSAETNLKRVLLVKPGDSLTHGTYSWLLMNRMQFEESVKEIKQAITLDPLTPMLYAWSVAIHNTAGLYDEALEEFEKAVEIEPRLGLAYFHKGFSLSMKGFFEQAIEAFEKSKEYGIYPGWAEGLIGIVYFRMGNINKSEELFCKMSNEKVGPLYSFTSLALLAGVLGKFDLAFENFNRALLARDLLMPFIHVYTKMIVPELTYDDRFISLLKKMKINFVV